MPQNMWMNFSDSRLLQVALDTLAVAAWFYRPFLVPREKPCTIYGWLVLIKENPGENPVLSGSKVVVLASVCVAV